MKLLIITQSIDKNNPVLGFMHRWIEEFAKKFESIVVICLENGEHSLPKNVKVLSLGKEKGASRFKYILRFYKYIWQERKNYDTVFVHMNQEYILLGGKLWWALRKPVYMWRNHQSGSFLTDIAAFFCKKVFCTSKYSYTAKYKKTVLMPVGIDMELFKPMPDIARRLDSILFLGRITLVKKPDLLIDALGEMKDREWTATVVGDALPKDADFYQKLKQKVHTYGMEDRIEFRKGVANQNAPSIYSAHEIFINLSPSGMYDKTIFEAMACGCLVLASNQNLAGQIDGRLIIGEEKSSAEVAQKIIAILNLSAGEKKVLVEQGSVIARKHSLTTLIDKLGGEMLS